MNTLKEFRKQIDQQAMTKIDFKYDHGQTVYLVTDPEQHPRMVTMYQVYKNEILYKCSLGTINSWHYDYELSDQIDTLKKVQ